MQVFQEKIWDFYQVKKREFAWRKTRDPYALLVSEVMLQQTQTSRVVPKYAEFIKKFPTLKILAEAKNENVLRLWNGLGYNRRALYLKQTAEIVIRDYSNSIPLNPKILQTLPGIGPNTAGAIYVFSTNIPHVFIETNIRRVFIHEFFKDQDKIDDKEVLKMIEQTLDSTNPREWYYALMDYGAYLPQIEKNPNIKSKHYAKQNKFEGSVRQVRGNILKILLEEKTVKTDELEKKISSSHFPKALEQMEKEEIILRQKNTFSIK